MTEDAAAILVFIGERRCVSRMQIFDAGLDGRALDALVSRGLVVEDRLTDQTYYTLPEGSR